MNDRPDVDPDKLLDQLNREQAAFDAFLAGYQLGVADAGDPPTAWRDRDRFSEYIRDAFKAVSEDD